eukprot:549945_1
MQNWLERRMEGNSNQAMRDVNHEENDNVEGVIIDDPDDPLMNFFIRSKLKQRHIIYNALQAAEIDYDELLDLDEKQFEDIFTLTPQHSNPILPGSLQLNRLYKALKSNPDSALFGENQKEKEKKIVYVQMSSEEEKALAVIKTSISANNSQIHSLCDKQLPKLKENFKQNHAIIESTFGEIIKCAEDQKAELQQELHRKTQEKQDQIQSQISDLNDRQKMLKQWDEESQSLIEDTALDPSQRKKQIMSLCKNVLNAPSGLAETIAEVRAQRQQIQIRGIKVGLSKAVLIDDSNDIAQEYKEESPPLSPRSDNLSIKSEDVTQTKAQKKRKRRSKNKAFAMAAAGQLHQQKSDSAPPPNATPSGAIMVKNTFHEVKEAIVDWWHPSPMETNNETHGAIPFTGYKMRECRWFATPGAFCSKRESCTYAHGLKELRQYNPLAKTIPCQWGERCQHMLEYGVCNYIHKKKKKSKKKKKAVKK